MDVLEHAADLADTIRSCRVSTDAERQLAAPVVDGIRAARLNRMVLTPENQGLATPLPIFLTVLETLAGQEPSASWIVWNNALACLFSRHLSSAARAELFAESGWIYANSTRPSGRAEVADGGYRMSGRWSLVSGCELAEWMPLMCLVTQDGRPRETDAGPELRFLFAHRSQVAILDTWHVGGLRGTGSHDVTVDDLFVPESRTLTPADPVTIEGPYAHLPIIGTIILGYAAQVLGIARAAIRATSEIGRSKVTPNPGPDMRDRPEVQLALAAETAALDAARTHLLAIGERVWSVAEQGSRCSEEDLAALYAAAWHATQTGIRAVDTLYSVAGTTAIYRDCPLERLSRDLRVMRQHVAGQPNWATNAGRVLLGLRPTDPLFAV